MTTFENFISKVPLVELSEAISLFGFEYYKDAMKGYFEECFELGKRSGYTQGFQEGQKFSKAEHNSLTN